jgi:hypothetical protein
MTFSYRLFETTISTLAILCRCNNRAENELFNKIYIEDQLNNNKYSAIEWNKDSWLNWD